MATEKKSITKKITEAAQKGMQKQGELVKTAAIMEGAKEISTELVKIVKPKLPMMVRGYADTPYFKAILCNGLMVAVETAFPEVGEDHVYKQMANAAVVNAYQEIFESFELVETIKGLFESPKMKKLTAAVTKEAK